jgi:metallo-beta-lactamase class B VIM
VIPRLAALLWICGCATNPGPRLEDVRHERILLSPTFELARLDDSTWIHTTSKQLPGLGLFPSNGLMVRADGGVVLIDTPWTPEATRALVDWVQTRLALPITDVIVTHSHDDRTGGVKELPASARVHALALTSTLAAKDGRALNALELPVAATTSSLAGLPVITFHPGAGHAPDNLLVWVPSKGLLMGGCFVRSAASENLGNLADADLASWRQALHSAQTWSEGFATSSTRPVIVVPGHGDLGGLQLLRHTRELVDRAVVK